MTSFSFKAVVSFKCSICPWNFFIICRGEGGGKGRVCVCGGVRRGGVCVCVEGEGVCVWWDSDGRLTSASLKTHLDVSIVQLSVVTLHYLMIDAQLLNCKETRPDISSFGSDCNGV